MSILYYIRTKGSLIDAFDAICRRAGQSCHAPSQEFMVCTGIDRIETGVPAYLVFEKCKRANGGIKNSAKALTIATGRTPSALPAQTAIGEGYQPVLIAARRMFKHVPELEYYVLDIERELLAKDLSSFHVITSTNCIHATQNLMNSLSKIRKMLRNDGVIALVEITTRAICSGKISLFIFSRDGGCS